MGHRACSATPLRNQVHGVFRRKTGFAERGEEGISRGGHAKGPTQLDERLVRSQNHRSRLFIHTEGERDGRHGYRGSSAYYL